MSKSKPLAALFLERETPIRGYHKGTGLLLCFRKLTKSIKKASKI